MAETMVYDAETGEVVTKSERRRRQAERAAAAGATCKRFRLPDVVERGSWVFDRASGALVPRGEYYAAKAAERHGSGPMLIRDDLGGGVNGLWHPATGRHTDSKSDFRRMTRDSGCVEVEGANLSYQPPPRPPVADSIKRAMQELGHPL